ncbi:MAG: transglycosylase SLT domain-containing protein [Desulfobacterales bacterium]
MARISMKRFFIGFGVLLCLMLLRLTPLYADIYVYVDNNGVLHFTNVPTLSKDYRVYLKERPKKISASNLTDQYDRVISEASKRHGVSFSLLKALIKAESDFDPRAVSSAGAQGLMQLMPENIKSLNIKNPFDPRENIMGGARYLKQLIKRFGGKLPLALAAYNAGPGVVEQYQRIPPFRETENFVQQVMKYYALLNNKS